MVVLQCGAMVLLWCCYGVANVLPGTQARALLRSHEFDPRGLGVARFDVLVTSYEIALQDVGALSRCVLAAI